MDQVRIGIRYAIGEINIFILFFELISKGETFFYNWIWAILLIVSKTFADI